MAAGNRAARRRLVSGLRDVLFVQVQRDATRGLGNLALALDKQGHTEEAERMGKQALAIYEKALGPDHPYTQRARRNWG